MASEHWEYAVLDGDGEHYVMPERMASAVVWVVPDVTMWRRLVHGEGDQVRHGDWHQVEVTQ